MSHRNRAPTCIAQVPAHIKEAWTPAERRYYEATYKKPRLGPEWSTAHRRVEMQMADVPKRKFFAGYWPHVARDGLERFKRVHYDKLPDARMDDSIARRISKWYPELFSVCLDPRMLPLFNAANTHTYLREYRERYEAIRELYFERLTAAATLAEMYRPGEATKKRQHDDYRAAFASIYDLLHDLLQDLCALCDSC